MDFNFTQEQRQMADSLKRWVGRDYGFEERARIVASAEGVSAAAWQALAELGMLALPLPQEQGGFDGSALDLFIVMRELGHGLVVEPYFATVLAVHLLKLGGRHGGLLEQVGAGGLTLAVALTERQSRYDLADIATSLTAQGGDYLLDGAKVAVAHGAQAGAVVVSARSAGRQRERAGISLVVVPLDAPGVSVTGYRTLDGQRAANIAFDQVRLPATALVCAPGAAWELLDAGADHGAALLCAEALGAMEAVFDATLAYLKARTQFGAPIGKFQALQHRMADMAIHLEQARSMALLAAAKADSADPGERRCAVSAAKYRVGQAQKFIGQQAVQLHGGMGVTDELPVSHYFKRLAMIELTLGDTSHHLRRFIAQPGFAHAEAA